MANNWKKYRLRRDEWLAGKVCSVCAVAEGNIEAAWRTPRLHPLPTSRVWSMVDEKRQRYLADCIVLCRSCLSRRNTTVGHFRVGHGEGVQGTRGCKCDLCIEQRRKYGRDRQRMRRGSA